MPTLAAKNSDDPGSKDKGGELGFARRGMMVPAFENAIFTQKIGDTQIVKSSFGYHIVQVEERQPAHAMSLAEVAPTIQMTLIRKKAAAAEENYAQSLTSEAIKNGLEKTATAHHLQFTTTPMVGERGVISAFADSSEVLGKAFAAKRGDPPQFARPARATRSSRSPASLRPMRPALPTGRRRASRITRTINCRRC